MYPCMLTCSLFNRIMNNSDVWLIWSLQYGYDLFKGLSYKQQFKTCIGLKEWMVQHDIHWSLDTLIMKTDLALRWNQLSSLPSEIGSLSALQRINLDYNHLKSLPSEIGNLVNLKVLHLCDNELESLPSGFSKLNNLQYLDLQLNLLESFPQELINLTNLLQLGLAYNQLSSLPPDVGNLTNLEVLSLHNNKLSSLPFQMANLTKLHACTVGNNHIQSNTPLPFIPCITGLGNQRISTTLTDKCTAFINKIKLSIP